MILKILIAGIFVILSSFIANDKPFVAQEKFMLGNEVLLQEKLGLISGKRVALITNHTGITSKGTHLADELILKKINITKIFTPEHGFGADDSYSSSGISVPVISLYGSEKSIRKSDLIDVDVLIFDMQELGARFYTYTSTLYLTIKNAIDNGKEYIVCDRPALCNPDYTGGFMPRSNFSSFVCLIPAPVMYGMTTGELASFLKNEYSDKDAGFTIIKMKGYTRKTDFLSLNLPWVNPSPNIITPEGGRIYPALCFLEGSNISEGRGTDDPFTLFGAPFCNGEQLKLELNGYNLPGVIFEATTFTPYKKTSSYTPKFLNKQCEGIKIRITDIYSFKPVETGVAILCALKNSASEFKWTEGNFIDKLSGTDKLRKMIENGSPYVEICDSWKSELNIFMSKREHFLLYH
ncbi:DUF1343 domain-containing protein [bacterium]|nr:MAG: DUF1343 domain-containing protein [bacterium]